MIVRVASHRIVPQDVVNYRPLIVAESGVEPERTRVNWTARCDWAALVSGAEAWDWSTVVRAKQAAGVLVGHEAHRARFVLLGRRVAAAFGAGHAHPVLVWMNLMPPAVPFLKVHAAIVPDPTGNRWYVRPDNQRRADEFWRALLEETR